MLTGWKSITQYTGFSRMTILKLADPAKQDPPFPLEYIASKPTTTRSAVQEWLQARLKRHSKNS